MRASCSYLMILGNAEPTIRLCMDSVLNSGCFDEYILVLDSRTRDRTPAILEDYRARYPRIRILWHEWKGLDYAAARNVGLKQARMERVYWQDSDEVLLDPQGIYSLLQQPAATAYHIWQISPTPDGGVLPVHQLRLFPRLPGVKWELPIHEQIVFSLMKRGIPQVISPYRVYHYGYASAEINTQKHRERAQVMGNWLRGHPRKDAKRHYLMEQYTSSMRYLRNLDQGGMS